jgi:hypothetical protein
MVGTAISSLAIADGARISPPNAGGRSDRIVKFPGGQVAIDVDRGAEHVIVTDADGKVVSDSWCDAGSGSYDELARLFRRFREAVVAENAAAVAKLVRFPLRVNDNTRGKIANSAELAQRYGKIFTKSLVDDVRKAAPEAIFCRNGSAMIGDGVVWAHSATGRVAIDVVNAHTPSPSAATASSEVVLSGTVIGIEAGKTGDPRNQWLVTMRVERVVSGRYPEPELRFAVHSPARSGLSQGKTYTVRVMRAETAGYEVDQYQWMQAR